jgi:hypothetical protein
MTIEITWHSAAFEIRTAAAWRMLQKPRGREARLTSRLIAKTCQFGDKRLFFPTARRIAILLSGIGIATL